MASPRCVLENLGDSVMQLNLSQMLIAIGTFICFSARRPGFVSLVSPCTIDLLVILCCLIKCLRQETDELAQLLRPHLRLIRTYDELYTSGHGNVAFY